MSFLDLDRRQEAQITEWAMANGTAAIDPTPGFLDGSLTAPLKGAAKGLIAEPARVLNLALSHGPAALDAVAGTKTRDWWYENMVGGMAPTIKALSVDPRSTGMAGQLLHGFFDIGSQAVVGGVMGGPGGAAIYTGINKTIGGATTGIDEGLDAHTAMQKGAIEGASAAVGVALPMTMTPMIGTKIPALLQQMGYGVAANVPVGIASRYLTHQTLEDGGYKDMAQQYKAIDENALIADAVLGVAFGGLGHWMQGRSAAKAKADADAAARSGSLLSREVMPSDVDAALTVLKADHIEKSGLGLPKDAASRNAHVDAVNSAMDDLIAGRQVKEHGPALDAEFVPNRSLDDVRTTISRHFVDQVRGVTDDVIQAADRLVEFVKKAVGDPRDNRSVEVIGTVDADKRSLILNKTGIDVGDAREQVRANAVRHSQGSHPDLTPDDWRMLPWLTKNFDDVHLLRPEPGDKGPRLAFVVRDPATGYAYVAEALAGEKKGKRLTVVTYFKDHPNTIQSYLDTNGVKPGKGARGASIDGSVSVLGRDEGATPVADFRNPSDTNIAQAKVGSGETALSSTSKDIQDGLSLAKPTLTNLRLTDPAQHGVVTRQAAEIAGENPNLPIASETLSPDMIAAIRKIKPDGPITAADVIAQSRADIELARREKGVFDVAVSCFLRH